jgi:hypothetical protein
MTVAKYIKSIEKIIAEHQSVQMAFPPTSQHWQNASTEIHRLAALILEAQKS